MRNFYNKADKTKPNDQKIKRCEEEIARKSADDDGDPRGSTHSQEKLFNDPNRIKRLRKVLKRLKKDEE